jgi:hypothetical protein
MVLKSTLGLLLMVLSFYVGTRYECSQLARQRTPEENRAISGFENGPKAMHEFKDR